MKLSKREFFKTVLDQDTRSAVMNGAGTGYVCFAFSLIGNLVLKFLFNTEINPYSMVELAVILGMAAGVQLLRSRICAVILLVYYLVNQVVLAYMQIQQGSGHMIFARIGLIMVFAGGFSMAVKGTFAFHKAWKQYQAGQYVPKKTSSEPKSLSELARMPVETDD